MLDFNHKSFHFHLPAPHPEAEPNSIKHSADLIAWETGPVQ